jgi:pectate lyase
MTGPRLDAMGQPTRRLVALMIGALAFLVACAPTESTGGGGGAGDNPGTGGGANPGGSGGSSGAAGIPGRGGSQGPGGSNGGAVAGTGGAAGGAGNGGAAGAAGMGGTDTGGRGGATTGGRGGTAGGGTAGAGGASTTGGRGGTAVGGAGGVAGRGGSGGAGGTAGSGTAGGGGATGADQCQAIGWATRTGRTGGAFNVTGGGSAAPIVVKTFAELQQYASDGQARVIHIDGTLGNGWSGNSGDRLEIKSNKTIVGLRAGTQLKAAIHFGSASNVILRNIVVRGPGSNEDQAWDNLSIEGSSRNVWVDHCEFWDGQDGNADVVKGADTVTFTWCIFGYALSGHPHNLSNLIASSDDEPESEGKLDITYMFNWWNAATERQPRCRYGQIHVVNNLFTANSAVGASKLGVTNGLSCNVLTENNHFISQNDPIDLGKQAGTGSVLQAVGNQFDSCTGNQRGSGTAFTPPYEYKSFMVPASGVKALVQKYAGATLASPTSCP